MLSRAFAGLLLLATAGPAGASLVSSFTGAFAPGDWQAISGSPGASSAFGAYTIAFTAPAAAGDFDDTLSITPSASVSYTLNLELTLHYFGDTSAQADYYVTQAGGSLLFQSSKLSGDGASVTFNNISVPAGDTLNIEFAGGPWMTGKDPAQLDLEVVPEAGAWLGAVFVFGVVVVSGLRKKSAGIAGKGL